MCGGTRRRAKGAGGATDVLDAPSGHVCIYVGCAVHELDATNCFVSFHFNGLVAPAPWRSPGCSHGN